MEYLAEYDPEVPGCLKFNSILSSNNKINAMAAGVKVKLSFSL
jgi:hypothetical protein